MAVETGGNVEGSEVGAIKEIEGVKVVGLANLARRGGSHGQRHVLGQPGQLCGPLLGQRAKVFRLDLEDELIKGCLITHDGQIFSETYKSII